MSDIEIYELACRLGDTETVFKLFEKNNTQELDFYMFLEDLSWSYVGERPFGFFNDIGYHLSEIFGQELSFVLKCLKGD